MALAFAAMMGWCGTMWPGWFVWWILHHRVGPPPPPDPDPWWRNIVRGIIGVIGGIGAVKIIGPDYPDAGLVGTAVLSFFGGVFLGSLADSVMAAGRSNVRA
jgi:hypothetical protein